MRSLQIWIPDTRTEAFRSEVARQCLAVNAVAGREEELDWLESINAIDDSPQG